MAQYDEKYGLVFEGQGNQNWGLTLHIPEKVPLTTNSIFDTYVHMMAYVNNPTSSAIQGLTLAVISDTDANKNGIYYIKEIGTVGSSGETLNNGVVVKLSTAADSVVSADAVQENLDKAISANTSAHTVFSGAISDNTTAISQISGSVSSLTSNFEIAVGEFQAADKYLSGVTSGIVESLTNDYLIKDVKSDDKMLSVDANGKLSSSFDVSYDSNARKIYFKGANDVSLGEVDASEFIADGMLSGATLVTEGDKTYIKFHFNTTGGGNDKISLDVTRLLNGTELQNLEASLSAHTASTTFHFTSDEKAKLTDLYTKEQLDTKFSANTEAHSNLSSDIAGVNTKIENILGNNTGYTGVTIPELNNDVSANTKSIEDLKSALSAHTSANTEEFESIREELSALTSANTAAHTTLQGNIDSANTRIDNVITAYTEADKAINTKISELEGKVDENEEVVAEALTELKANKVSEIAAEEESNIVVNEIKTENGISYTIGFQWLTF